MIAAMKETASNAGWSIVAAIALGILFVYPASSLFTNLGWTEGRLFPVSSDFELVESKEVPHGINMTLRFTKHRNCDFVEWHWYMEKSPGRFTDVFVVDLQRTGEPFSRPMGDFEVDWLLISNMTPNDKKLYAVLDHRCWGPLLWKTHTQVEVKAGE